MSIALSAPVDSIGLLARNQRLLDAGLTQPTLAVLEALQFRGGSSSQLAQLGARTWEALLPWCDSCQITLLLGELCPQSLPPEMLAGIHEKYADYQLRMHFLTQELAAIASVLEAAAIPFLLLKGFTHSPELCADPIVRAQADIDLWCPLQGADQAYSALHQIGYRAAHGSRSDRHLPPLAVPRAWQWRGKVSEVPISVELHHQLWSTAGEGIPIGGFADMWERREVRSFPEGRYTVLSSPDLLAFAATHFFLHLIHGDLPLQRLWEIANFLQKTANDVEFWHRLDELHSPELKQIEALVFAIAAGWLNCDRPSWALKAEQRLPRGVKLWLRDFLFSPLLAVADSNKNYLWLRLALVPGRWARLRLLISTLLPLRLPTYGDGSSAGGRRTLVGLGRQLEWLLARGRRHLRAIIPTLAGGVHWAMKRADCKPGLGAFLVADILFDVGEFLFVVLYSLYLLSLGLREDMIGLIASAMTAGNLIGSPIAALCQRRIGLRGLLLVGAIGGGAAGLLRALPLSPLLLLATAALNGILSSFWGVAYAPVIASVTGQRNRSTAFGFFTAMAMSIGIFAGLLAVRLPEWLSSGMGIAPLNGKRTALCLSCALVLLSAIPAAALKLAPSSSPAARIYPRGPFIRIFVSALFLYMFATSSFNSFGIPYLALRLHLPERQIGTVFSTGQTLQVVAMLCAPLLIRRLGERRYVFLTALATATLLLFLALGPAWTALGCYLAYLSFQYMGEPSLFALLMNRVNENERSGASTILLLTMSIAATLAAAIAGRLITRFSYSVSLTVAAAVAGVAAILFLAVPDFASDLQNRDNK